MCYQTSCCRKIVRRHFTKLSFNCCQKSIVHNLPSSCPPNYPPRRKAEATLRVGSNLDQSSRFSTIVSNIHNLTPPPSATAEVGWYGGYTSSEPTCHYVGWVGFRTFRIAIKIACFQMPVTSLPGSNYNSIPLWLLCVLSSLDFGFARLVNIL